MEDKLHLHASHEGGGGLRQKLKESDEKNKNSMQVKCERMQQAGRHSCLTRALREVCYAEDYI